MKLKKLPIYELPLIARSAELEAWAFQELKEKDQEGVEIVKKFRAGMDKLFQDFDRRWIALCEEDVFELTEWAGRMRFVRSHLDELDRNLAVAGTRLFNWEKVCLAMGYVNSIRVAVEQVLSNSKE